MKIKNLTKLFLVAIVLQTVLVSTSKTAFAATNLIQNQSLETAKSSSTPTNWGTGNWGNNTTEFKYPVSGYNSSKAVQVNITKITDGDAKWFFDDVSVNSGKSYTFSNYYKTNVSTQVYARYQANDGSFTYVLLGSPAASSSTWKQFTKSFIVPSGVKSLTVFHVLTKVGTLTTDEFSLTEDGTSTSNKFTKGMVTLSFDDGWATTYNNAFPIMNKAKIKATTYIVTDFLGTTSYITKSNVLAMQTSGHEIGSHTKTHPQLPTLTTEQITSEVSGSMDLLKSYGVNKVTSFAYPYGEYNQQVIDAVKAAGYKSARTAIVADSGYTYKDTNPYLLKNFSVEINTSVAQIKTWIDTAVSSKAWTILVFHQVDNKGGQYSITPANFQKVVDYIKSKGVQVVTVSEGVTLMGN